VQRTSKEGLQKHIFFYIYNIYINISLSHFKSVKIVVITPEQQQSEKPHKNHIFE